jgi:hypothetical protein
MDAYTWILVIEVVSLLSGDFRLAPSRTRDLTEAACLILVQEVRSSKTIAYCYEDGTPDPGRRAPRIKERPNCDECPPPGRRWVGATIHARMDWRLVGAVANASTSWAQCYQRAGSPWA